MATLLLNTTFLKPLATPKVKTLASPKQATPISSSLLTSQFTGLSISLSLPNPALVSSSAFQPIVASRVCPFTGKRTNRANKVSFSKHRTKKQQRVNLQYKRLWWEAGNRFVKLRLSTKALKTIEKHGLDAMAKQAGIDLTKK